MNATIRFWARSIYFKSGARTLLRRARFGSGPGHRTSAYWDHALAGPLSTYLGGTVSIAIRDGIVGALVAHFARGARTLADIGCAAGSLSRALAHTSIKHYLGVDISGHAVNEATRRRDAAPNQFVAQSEFFESDLCSFQFPPSFVSDILIFNEVLYYLEPGEAVSQVVRLAASTTARGLILVGMKHDPKSALILSKLRQKLRWQDGVLYQEKLNDFGYRVTINRERPAYMLAVFSRAADDAPDERG